MAFTTSLLTLRTDVLDIIRADEGDAVYPNSLLNRAINKAQRDLASGTIRHPQTGEWINNLNIPYLSKENFYTSVIATSISTTATAGATSLTVASTDGYASSGYLCVDNNIIYYASKTPTTFATIPATGTGSIAFGHIAGTTVFPLYSLPSDCNYIQQLTYDRTMELSYVDYREVSRTSLGVPDSSSASGNAVLYYPTTLGYTVLHGQYILIIHRNILNGKPLKLFYQSKPTDLSSDSDISGIDDNWARSVIPYLASAEIMKNRGELDSANGYEQQAFDEAKKHTLINSRQTGEQFFRRKVSHGYVNWHLNI